MPHITRGLSDDRIRPPSFCLALASLAPPQANCKASCAVNHTLPSDVVPTLTAPTRVPEIIPKSTSAIFSTSNTLLVSGSAAVPVPDMPARRWRQTARRYPSQTCLHDDGGRQPPRASRTANFWQILGSRSLEQTAELQPRETTLCLPVLCQRPRCRWRPQRCSQRPRSCRCRSTGRRQQPVQMIRWLRPWQQGE